MKQRMAPWVVVVLIVCGGGAAARAAEPGGAAKQQATSPLEGTIWSVKVTPDAIATQNGEKPFDDSLIFKDGRITMSACAKMGFAPSSYTALPAGAVQSFTTHQMSLDQGTTRWTGTFTGETVKGTMVWTKKNGAALHYSFEGKNAAKPVA